MVKGQLLGASIPSKGHSEKHANTARRTEKSPCVGDLAQQVQEWNDKACFEDRRDLSPAPSACSSNTDLSPSISASSSAWSKPSVIEVVHKREPSAGSKNIGKVELSLHEKNESMGPEKTHKAANPTKQPMRVARRKRKESSTATWLNTMISKSIASDVANAIVGKNSDDNEKMTAVQLMNELQSITATCLETDCGDSIVNDPECVDDDGSECQILDQGRIDKNYQRIIADLKAQVEGMKDKLASEEAKKQDETRRIRAYA